MSITDRWEAVDNWLEVITAILREDGYLILGDVKPHRIGELVPDQYKLGIPFRVSGEATIDDAIRQFKRLAALTGASEYELVAPPPTYRYYKTVVAD